MFVKKFGHKVIARLESGEDVPGCIREICSKHRIYFAKITAIGTMCNLTLDNAKPMPGKLKGGNLNILPGTALVSGYIATKPEGVYVNLFIYIDEGNKRGYMAKLSKCNVNGTCEIVIDIIDGCISEDILRKSCID